MSVCGNRDVVRVDCWSKRVRSRFHNVGGGNNTQQGKHLVIGTGSNTVTAIPSLQQRSLSLSLSLSMFTGSGRYCTMGNYEDECGWYFDTPTLRDRFSSSGTG